MQTSWACLYSRLRMLSDGSVAGRWRKKRLGKAVRKTTLQRLAPIVMRLLVILPPWELARRLRLSATETSSICKGGGARVSGASSGGKRLLLLYLGVEAAMDVFPGEVGIATRLHEARKAFGDLPELRNLSDVELVWALTPAQGE